MREGRRAAATLNSVLEKFEGNPKSFLLGGSQVPEYNPRGNSRTPRATQRGCATGQDRGRSDMFRSAPVFATGLMCLGLAGCALALGGTAAPTTYDLIAPRSFAAMPKGARYQLVVNEPTSVHALD